MEVIAAAPRKESAAADDKSVATTHRQRRRHMRPTVILAAVLVALVVGSAGIAYLIGGSAATVYAARTDLVYVGAAGDSSLDDQAIETQTALLTGQPVLAAVADEADADVDELAETISAERVEGSQLIQLTVQSSQGAEAVRIADLVVTTYLSTSAGATSDPRELEFLNARLGELQAQLVAAQTLEESGVTLQLISQQIADIQSRLTDLQLDEINSVPPLRVIAAAYELPEPVSPRPLRSAAAGGLVGFLVAVTLAVIVLSRRRTAGPPE